MIQERLGPVFFFFFVFSKEISFTVNDIHQILTYYNKHNFRRNLVSVIDVLVLYDKRRNGILRFEISLGRHHVTCHMYPVSHAGFPVLGTASTTVLSTTSSGGHIRSFPCIGDVGHGGLSCVELKMMLGSIETLCSFHSHECCMTCGKTKTAIHGICICLCILISILSGHHANMPI